MQASSQGLLGRAGHSLAELSRLAPQRPAPRCQRDPKRTCLSPPGAWMSSLAPHLPEEELGE